MSRFQVVEGERPLGWSTVAGLGFFFGFGVALFGFVRLFSGQVSTANLLLAVAGSLMFVCCPWAFVVLVKTESARNEARIEALHARRKSTVLLPGMAADVGPVWRNQLARLFIGVLFWLMVPMLVFDPAADPLIWTWLVFPLVATYFAWITRWAVVTGVTANGLVLGTRGPGRELRFDEVAKWSVANSEAGGPSVMILYQRRDLPGARWLVPVYDSRVYGLLVERLGEPLTPNKRIKLTRRQVD